MATAPSTATKAVGSKVAASWANDNVKAPIDFIWDPPRCRVYDGVGVSMANSAFTLLTFSAEANDTDSMHSTASNTSRITINTSGTYRVDFYSILPSGSTYTVYSVNLRKNAAGAPAGGSSMFTHQQGSPGGAPFQARFSFEIDVTAGEHYEFFIFQTSGAAKTTLTGDYVTGTTWVWLRP